MDKWIKERFDSWDLKSLGLTVLILLILFFAWFYFSDIRDRFRTADQKTFKGRTRCEIIKIDTVESIRQSKYKGTRIDVDSYVVFYEYVVDGQTFEQSDLIPATAQNLTLLRQVLKRRPNETFVVKFDIEDPRKSRLIESE